MNRGSCELCNCGKFTIYCRDIRYKCRCGHGDVWHHRVTNKPVSKVKPKDKIKNSLKKFVKPFIKIFNTSCDTTTSKECPICFNNIKTLVVLNCGHAFCFECSKSIVVTCPMCRKYITNKIKVF